MVTMTESLLPRSRPLTRADLDALPDDGHRYELIDGTLIVSPAPKPRHQVVVGGLYRSLHRRCPDDLIVRHIELMLKRSRFEAAGCPGYWVVDPDEPSLRAWKLHDGAYEEVGHVVGATAFHAERPFPVDIAPEALIDRL